MAERPMVWSEGILDGLDISAAFQNNDHIVRCMDERTPGGIHAAGSGLLVATGAGKFDTDTTAQIQFLKQSGAKGITRHRGCGAEAAWTKEMNLTLEEAEAKLQARTTTIANELGISFEMIEFDAMQGSKDGHKTAVIYYDATGTFDYSKHESLPTGFIVSRGLHPNAEYSLFEVNFAIGIILGHHGLGSNWLKENNKKITIVAIESNDLPVDRLVRELSPLKEANVEHVEIVSVQIDQNR